MKFPGFGRKKSKARHTSPVQQLVISTQNIGRAHSLTDLNSTAEINSIENFDRNRRWESEPPLPVQMAPSPSAGSTFSRKKSETETARGRPPRPSYDTFDGNRSTKSTEEESQIIEQYSPLSNKRTLNELNDIVETLKNENAGLKEKIKLVESEHNREKTETEKKHRKSRKERSRRKEHSAETSESLNSFLDFPVDKVAAELQKVISDLQVENQKLNSTVVRKDGVIDKLKDDIQNLQTESTELKRQNLFFGTEVEDLKVTREKLSLDLFEAKHKNAIIENEKSENILELERNIRTLENDLQVARINFDQISREKASGISQIDHHRIIKNIQNTFQEEIKQKEVELLTEKIETAKQEETNNELNLEISALLREKEEIFVKAENIRQKHVEEQNSVAPIIIENEMLKNKNQLLEQRLNGAQREIYNLHHQQELDQRLNESRMRPGNRNLEMKTMMLTLQDDWKDIAKLITEVELEKSSNLNQSYGVELKKLNNIALDMQQRENEVQTREQEAFRLLSVATLRDVSQRRF